MSEHTPTPWRLRTDFGGFIQGSPRKGQTYGEAVTNVGGVAKPKGVGAANTALIIEAVNNHEPLKAEVSRLRSELDLSQKAVDVLESNARQQAKLLADTGRELDQARRMVEEARNGFLAIQKATVDGIVCDDVAWFSSSETLHDYCGHMADRLTIASTERHCTFCHVPMGSSDCCESDFEAKGCPHMRPVASPERQP